MDEKVQIIESVPNFSEGRNKGVIKQITDAVESVDGIKLLNVDIGEAANRTVVTFVGEPEAVVEAAFRATKKAGEVIDMRCQHGEHPRIGATDVLPLVPVRGISLEECAQLARALAERIANEARIPCFCYEASAFKPERRNLAVCRAGEYEGIAERIVDKDKAPDYGARPYDESIARTGCSVVGARDFLLAVNFNLNTTSASLAHEIAMDVRQKGRPERCGDPQTGPIRRNSDGKPIMHPGTLKGVKALGWYIKEYGIAQVSMNITDINATPLHIAYEEVKRCAALRGLQVTGTEIIGLVPERVLIAAGHYYLDKKGGVDNVTKARLLEMAINEMGLSDLREFHPEEKVIEYLMSEQ